MLSKPSMGSRNSKPGKSVRFAANLKMSDSPVVMAKIEGFHVLDKHLADTTRNGPVILCTTNVSETNFVMKPVKRNEAKKCTRFFNRAGKSPYVLGYHGTMVYQHTLYAVLEYAPKGDAFDKIGEFYRTNTVRTAVAQLAMAVHHMHSNGVAHLDLKPENIFIGADGTLKVGDFDTIVFGCDFKGRTKYVGTRGYLSPELIRCMVQRKPSFETNYLFAPDIFTLGLMIFTALTGLLCHLEEETPIGIFWAEHIAQNNFAGFFNTYKSELGDLLKPEDVKMLSRMLDTRPHMRPSSKVVVDFFAPSELGVVKGHKSIITRKPIRGEEEKKAHLEKLEHEREYQRMEKARMEKARMKKARMEKARLENEQRSKQLRDARLRREQRLLEEKQRLMEEQLKRERQERRERLKREKLEQLEKERLEQAKRPKSMIPCMTHAKAREISRRHRGFHR